MNWEKVQNTVSDRVFDNSLAHRLVVTEIAQQTKLINKVLERPIRRLDSYKAYVKLKKTILRVSQQAGTSPTLADQHIGDALIESDGESCLGDDTRVSSTGLKAPKSKKQIQKDKTSTPIASNDFNDALITPVEESGPSNANNISKTGVKARKSKKQVQKARTSTPIAGDDFNDALITPDEESGPSNANNISRTGVKARKSKKQVQKARTSTPIAGDDFNDALITPSEESSPSNANKISRTGVKARRSKKQVKQAKRSPSIAGDDFDDALITPNEQSGSSNTNGISKTSTKATRPKRQVRKTTKMKQINTQNFSDNVTPKRRLTRSTRSTAEKENLQNIPPSTRLTRLQLRRMKSEIGVNTESLAVEDPGDTTENPASSPKIVNRRKATKKAISRDNLRSPEYDSPPEIEGQIGEEMEHPVDALPANSPSYSTNEEFIVPENRVDDLEEELNTSNTVIMTQSDSPGATSLCSQLTVLIHNDDFCLENASPRSQGTNLMEEEEEEQEEDFNEQCEKEQSLNEESALLSCDSLPCAQILPEVSAQSDVEDKLDINMTKSASPTRNSLDKDLDNQSSDTFIWSSTAEKQPNSLDKELLDNSTNQEIINEKNSPMHQMDEGDIFSQERSPSLEFKSLSSRQNTSDDEASCDWEDKMEVRSKSASPTDELTSYIPAYQSGVPEEEKKDFTVQVHFDDIKMSSDSPEKIVETEELEDSITVPLEADEIKHDEQKHEVRSRSTRSASLEKNIQSTMDSSDELSTAETPHSTTENPPHSPERKENISEAVSHSPGQCDDEFLSENEIVSTQSEEINIFQDRAVSIEYNSPPNSQELSDNEAQDDVEDKIDAGSEKSASQRHASPSPTQSADEAGDSDNEDVKSDKSASNHSPHHELDFNDEVKSDVDKISICSRPNSPAQLSLNFDMDTQEEMEDYSVTYRRQTPLPMLESAPQDEISQTEIEGAKSPGGKSGSTLLRDSGIDETSQDMSDKEYFEDKSQKTSGAACGEKRPPKITSTEILTSKYKIIGKRDGIKSPGKTNKPLPENKVAEDHVYNLDNKFENMLGIDDQAILDEQEKLLAMRSPEEKRPKKTVRNVAPRPVQLRDLVKKDNLHKISCMRSTLAIDDMTPDDEIIVMEFPKSILDNQDLVGKKMRLKLRTLRIGNTMYEIQRQNNSGPIPCILNKHHGTSKYRKGVIQPSARIVIRQALEDPNDSIVSTEGLSESKTSSFPTNLKQRNQFIDMSTTYSSDIADQETHKRKRDSTPDTQVPKKKKLKKTRTSEPDGLLSDCNTSTNDEITKQERDPTPEIHVTKKKKKSKRPASDGELVDGNTPTNDEITRRECDSTPEIDVPKEEEKFKDTSETDDLLNDSNRPTDEEIKKQEIDPAPEIHVTKKKKKSKRRAPESEDASNQPIDNIGKREYHSNSEIHVPKKEEKPKRRISESDSLLNDFNTPTNDEITKRDCDSTSEIDVPKEEEKFKGTSATDDLLNDSNRQTDEEIEKQEPELALEIHAAKKKKKSKRRAPELEDASNQPTDKIGKRKYHSYPEIQIPKKEEKPKRRISESDCVLNDFNPPKNDEIKKQEPDLAPDAHVTKRKKKSKRRTIESNDLSSDFNQPKIEEIPKQEIAKQEDNSTPKIHIKKKKKKSKGFTSESDDLLSDINKPTNDEIAKQEHDSTLQIHSTKRMKKIKTRISESDNLFTDCNTTTNDIIGKRKRDSTSEQTPEIDVMKKEKKFKDESELDVKKKKKIFFTE